MSDDEKSKNWRERKQSIKHRWTIPFVYLEWRSEQLSKILEQWAFLDILGHAGRLTILVAVIFYIKGCPERQRQAEDQRKAKQYQAWQVISAAQGKPGDLGRSIALEDLNKDKVSLAGVDISKANLPMLNLTKAKLSYANLTEAYLKDVNLIGADLEGANLTGAYLDSANLTGADLNFAHLIEAKLYNSNLTKVFLFASNLTKADLEGANLNGAYPVEANLTEANLHSSNLAGADLRGSNLAGADLTGANLSKADIENIKNWRQIKSIKLANVYDVNNPPDGFIDWVTAPEQGAVRIKDEEEWRKYVFEKVWE